MTSLIKVLLEINVLIIILYTGYFLIKSQLSFRLRKRLIIMVPLLAILSILVQHNIILNTDYAINTAIQLDVISLSSGGVKATSAFYDMEFWYYTGVIVFALWLLIKLFKVIRFFKPAFKSGEDVKVLSTSNKDSFSFFNFIHLSANLDDIEKQVVLDHELIHVNKKHTLDIVLMEIYHSLFWFNPLFLFIKKELVYVHEYEVDQEMYGKYENDYVKHLLVQSLGANSAQLLLTSQFYNGLSLTKRTKTMKTKLKTRNSLWIVLPLIASAFAFVSWIGVEDISRSGGDQPEKVISELDEQPTFKGGQEAMIKYLVEHIKYPEAAKKEGVEGKVFVRFTVEKTGQVADAEIVKGVREDIDYEALRVIDGMPLWNPGKKDGKPVNSKMVIPINFKL